MPGSLGTEPAISRLRRIAAARADDAGAPVGRSGGPLDPATSAAIEAELGSGAPLPDGVRHRMEAAFGTSLGHVRVHGGPAAERLNDAVSAQAFTVGRDVFVGRVPPAAGQQVLAHEIAHVLAEPGDVRRLRRWWEPMKQTVAERGIPSRALPQPVPGKSPKNQDGVRWEDKGGEPRHAYRFVDAQNRGFEAADIAKPFVQNDWHRAAERAAVWWFDATTSTWQRGEAPADRRTALPEERPADVGTDLHGYASPADVPVYVKARYRPKKDSKKTKRDRGPGLRALDRAARVLMQDMPSEGTPHLATAAVGGSLVVAGNTGTRNVTGAAATEGTENLGHALDPRKRSHAGRRAAKDATKLRALQSGDYRAKHPDADAELRQVSRALTAPPIWRNVDAPGPAAEHGEMTVLADLHTELAANPNRTGTLIVRKLGGVKLACGACAVAFEAYNRFVAARLGYAVDVSGTHGGFYNGWRVPDVIWNNPAALAHVRARLPGRLDNRGVLYGIDDSSSGYHDPEESDSEWEEV
jgi:hypothetical protein